MIGSRVRDPIQAVANVSRPLAWVLPGRKHGTFQACNRLENSNSKREGHSERAFREQMQRAPTKVPTMFSGDFFVCEVCAGKILEARVGIEPTHKGFADLSLTTWVPRLGWGLSASALLNCGRSLPQTGVIWSGRPGSNRRHLPWQGSTLPLSYSRSYRVKYSGPVRYGQRRLACYCTAIIV